MEPFKDLINLQVVEKLGENLENIYPGFKSKKFQTFIMEALPQLELKQRITRIVEGVHQSLTGDYLEDIKILDALGEMSYGEKGDITALCLPEYVSTYGLDHFDFSMDALERYTVYCSAEFAVREFIILDQERAFKKIYRWKNSDNLHVRRLSSEGCRPRLPWGKKLQALVADPEPLREILEQLKSDESDYVRKSVANNLNDISKDNPEWMLDLVESWDKTDKKTAWIIKHGARGLIKDGYPRVFPLFGFSNKPKLNPGEISLSDAELEIGDSLEFSFPLENCSGEDIHLAVDYKVYYQKKTGRSLPKVFKLKEVSIKPGETIQVRKKHSFADVSIRKHFPGIHKIEIVINGETVKEVEFTLK